MTVDKLRFEKLIYSFGSAPLSEKIDIQKNHGDISLQAQSYSARIFEAIRYACKNDYMIKFSSPIHPEYGVSIKEMRRMLAVCEIDGDSSNAVTRRASVKNGYMIHLPPELREVSHINIVRVASRDQHNLLETVKSIRDNQLKGMDFRVLPQPAIIFQT